jgi:uncharacterized protein YdiU (UPF0061 family)
VELANEAIGSFEARFKRHWLAGMRAKLGLFTEESSDAVLIQDLLDWMLRTKSDFTNTFRSLSSTTAETDWHQRWQARLRQQPQSANEVADLMRRHNPAVIPRNHKVEEALAAAEKDDLSVMQRLLAVLAKPYDNSQHQPDYMTPAPQDSCAYQTFCGT